MLKLHDSRQIRDLAEVPSNFHVSSEIWVMCWLILLYLGRILLIFLFNVSSLGDRNGCKKEPGLQVAWVDLWTASHSSEWFVIFFA